MFRTCTSVCACVRAYVRVCPAFSDQFFLVKFVIIFCTVPKIRTRRFKWGNLALPVLSFWGWSLSPIC